MTADLWLLLSEGDRKQVAHAGTVAKMVQAEPALVGELIRCIIAGDAVIRSHGAHALMQVGTKEPRLLADYKADIIKGLSDIDQWEVQEQLLKILPLLPLDRAERQGALSMAHRALGQKSSIARTCALQALHDFAQQDQALRPEVLAVLQEALETGSKAMQARARKLVKSLSR